MKGIVSQMQRTTELFRQRRSLRTLLRLVGFSSLLVCSLFLFRTDPSSASVPQHSRVVHTVTRQAGITSSHVDLVLVVDNINEIQAHDPTGARFRGAQMFVDQASAGDRIGVVRIPSSDRPSSVKLLDLTTIHNGNDRNTVKHVLTQSFFGSIDPGPTAYFVPAFETASQMLLTAQDKNPKEIIVLTDSLAQAGDQEPCAAAPDQYHQWFCEIPKLEAHTISVIFFSFTIPGNEAELQPMRQYLKQHGGIVFQVG